MEKEKHMFNTWEKNTRKATDGNTSADTVSHQIVLLSLAHVSKYELSLGHHDIAITPGIRYEQE